MFQFFIARGWSINYTGSRRRLKPDSKPAFFVELFFFIFLQLYILLRDLILYRQYGGIRQSSFGLLKKAKKSQRLNAQFKILKQPWLKDLKKKDHAYKRIQEWPLSAIDAKFAETGNPKVSWKASLKKFQSLKSRFWPWTFLTFVSVLTAKSRCY